MRRRDELSDDVFRDAVAEDLLRHAASTPVAAREALLRSLSYRPVDVNDSASVSAVVDLGGGALAAYLALPPAVFPAAVTALAASGLPAGSRIVLEKPFGEDLEGALALNRLLARAARDAGEQAVFRVDHVLGMATVQNLLGMRVAGTVLEASLEQRSHRPGRDPLGGDARTRRPRRRTTTRPAHSGTWCRTTCSKSSPCWRWSHPPGWTSGSCATGRSTPSARSDRLGIRQTRRARYSAGRLAAPPDGSGRAVPAYTDEDGVEPERQTETFAELALELAGERWAGTRFVLRAGKALSRRRKMAVVHFRSAADELRIGLDGPEDVTLQLTGGAPGSPVPLPLSASPPTDEIPAYGRVLLDVLNGGSTLSVRGDEAEQAWRVVTPVLEAWSQDLVPLEEYPAGSAGPP